MSIVTFCVLVSKMILFLICVVLISVEVSSEFDYSNYGITWTYFPDGNGRLQMAFLTQEPVNKQISRITKQDLRKMVSFQLYRQHSQREPKQITYNTHYDSIADFNPKLDVKFIVHGWKSNSNTEAIINMKNAYLSTGDYNIFTVNWEEIAQNNYYFSSAEQTKDVGGAIAEMIDELVFRGGDLSRIHIIGHSLGAHTSGYAGKLVSSGKVGRITGLDPARLGFQSYFDPKGERRINKSDAEFVDVIHTDIGLVGYVAPLGHADFYPNRGSPPQPGCEDFSKRMESCSHSRSHQFFTESIITKIGFYSYPCASYDIFLLGLCKSGGVLMGENVPRTSRGVFYLRTTATLGSFATGP